MLSQTLLPKLLTHSEGGMHRLALVLLTVHHSCWGRGKVSGQHLTELQVIKTCNVKLTTSQMFSVRGTHWGFST